MMRIADLPHLNALLNAAAAVLLTVGFILIRRGHWRGHAACMAAATFVSAAFLGSYLVYHHSAGEQSTRHMAWLPPWLRAIYLAILFPHLLLAMVMLPMIALTFWRVARRQWEKHRRIARPTLAVWLFVSITGVIIYGMLYHLFPALKP